MKFLFVGGTGNISTSCSRLALQLGHELWLLHRPGRPGIAGARDLPCDINDEVAAAVALATHQFDAVVQFIGFEPAQIERDVRLFSGRCRQYVFLSSASAYAKPRIFAPTTERTPLENPHWQYSRNKIACEQVLRRAGLASFPYTIVRPSHTYDTVIPLPIGGWTDFTTVERMRRGQPVIVPGDGTSPWTITHAEDFAQGLLGLLGNARALGEDYQITSEEALTWDELYTQTAAAAGAAAPKLVHIPSDLLIAWNPDLEGTLRGDKAHTAVFDNAKLRRAVSDFRPRVAYRDGIRRTLAWFDADASRRRLPPETDAFIEKVLAAYAKAWPAEKIG
ncbi:MAG: NAD-dependent epimerase/dehydratase family protein [Opitutaceae bacterium]|nr:NAD-dependent epimerase/dehydratase family protein [Opitutaceae bacterium]